MEKEVCKMKIRQLITELLEYYMDEEVDIVTPDNRCFKIITVKRNIALDEVQLECKEDL